LIKNDPFSDKPNKKGTFYIAYYYDYRRL